MNLREFLISPIAYQAPARAIEGLDAADAEQHLEGSSHSIAEIVAHLAFWQQWFLARCSGSPESMPATAAAGWPAVESGSWPGLQTRFLEELEALAALADGDVTASVMPAIEFPPLAHYTVADVLVHVATHNAHHLGQVIVLRQIGGTWPPPAGSWTW